MNILIKGAEVLQRENGAYRTKCADIAIEGDRILAVGDIPESFQAERVINASGKLATPALINCHTHAYMGIFRNLADDLTFEDWLFGSIMPREDRMTNDQAKVGVMLSLVEMMKSGCGTYLDMQMFPGTSCEATVETGMRAVISRGLASEMGEPDGGAERRFREALWEIKNYGSYKNLSFMIGPHAIYTCGEKTLRYAAELANKLSIGINIHLSETKTEFNECMEKHGMTPTKYCDTLGLLSEKTVAAHCVQLTNADIDILAERKVNVATCPISNMKLGNGFAPVEKFYEKGINVVLGTDSSASNNTVNLFPDMRAFALVHKGKSNDVLSVPASKVIDAVTVNAAKALSLENGEITAGKLADIALFDLSNPTFRPKNNLASALAYSANGSEVSHLMVGGKFLVENGEVLTADCEKIYYEAEKVIESL